MSTNIEITLIIPVHNGGHYISKTLDSALAQTIENFEILCIDDASTDDSARILQNYVIRDSRIKVLTPSRRLGSAPKSLNFALPQMKGHYFVYSSQDDIFSPDWLEKMLARAQATGADAVIPDVVLFDEANPTTSRTLSGLAGDRDVQLSGRDACLQSLDWSIPGNALWNANIVRQLGFSDFSINSDEYSVRRFFLACNKVAFSDGQFFYRQDNPEAVTKRICASSFDWPLTQLHLAQLLLQNNFPSEVVLRECKQAKVAMRRLEKKLNKEWSVIWSDEEVARARDTARRFHDYLESEHEFAWPIQEKKFFKHSSKCKNHIFEFLKKIYYKLK